MYGRRAHGLSVVALWLAAGIASAALAQTVAPPPLAAQRMAPALDPAARRLAMVGFWYGEANTVDGRPLRWVTEREVNGTYRTHYQTVSADGNTEESEEMGQWGLSGGVFFTLQRAWIRNGENLRADPSNVYSADAYDLLSLSDRLIEYRSVGSGKHFTARRVTRDFRLRPLPGTH